MTKKWCLYLGLFCLTSCNNREAGEKQVIGDSVSKAMPSIPVIEKLPFVGVRGFETRKGISGTGTPHRQVEIKADGTVVFSFEQINQADENDVVKGTYNAGMFKKIVKCVFAEWDNEVRYYEITSEKIYETDEKGIRLKLEDCCEDGVGVCACEGDLYE